MLLIVIHSHPVTTFDHNSTSTLTVRLKILVLHSTKQHVCSNCNFSLLDMVPFGPLFGHIAVNTRLSRGTYCANDN